MHTDRKRGYESTS